MCCMCCHVKGLICAVCVDFPKVDIARKVGTALITIKQPFI